MTAFGIFWGTAMLALLMGGAEGLKHFMGRNFEGFSTNAATIFPGRTTKSYAGFNKGREVVLNTKDISDIRRSIPEINHSSGVLFQQAAVMYGQKKTNGQLSGVEADYDKIFEPIVYEGRFINEADDAQGRKVCVLGRKMAEDLFGTGQAVGHEVEINNMFYKVAGVIGQTSEINIGASMDESVFIPMRTMRSAYNMGDKVHIFMMTFQDGVRPATHEDRIRRIIASNHPIAPDDRGAVEFFKISELFEMVDNVFLGITILAIIVGAGTLMSGVIGVGNIMWIIVRERTHEIGIRRALGAKPRDIITQILCESMVLTTIAGIAGIVFAVIILWGAEMLTDGPRGPIAFQLGFSQAVGILVTFLLLGTAAGVVPALKAMRIKPIEALNDK